MTLKALSWNAPSDPVLSPKGERLVTLRYAGTYLSERFTTVLQDDAVLEGIVLKRVRQPVHVRPTLELGEGQKPRLRAAVPYSIHLVGAAAITGSSQQQGLCRP